MVLLYFIEYGRICNGLFGECEMCVNWFGFGKVVCKDVTVNSRSNLLV